MQNINTEKSFLDAIGGDRRTIRRPERGRPSRRQTEPEMTNETPDTESRKYHFQRTSLTLNREYYNKIKIIADTNSLNINEIIDAALSLYIDKYEKKHGQITPRESKIRARDLV